VFCNINMFSIFDNPHPRTITGQALPSPLKGEGWGGHNTSNQITINVGGTFFPLTV
jgi:hypothetical protein